MLAEITGVPVQPNKAIIGRNAFAHEAGIHQDGVVKNPLTYEIMTPQSVGVPNTQLVLGKHSGRHALGRRCEQLGFTFERPVLDGVYKKFLVLADKVKTVENHHLLELIREAQHNLRFDGSKTVQAAAAPNGRDAQGNPHTPLPGPAAMPLSIVDSSARAAEPQLMSEQEEREGYYWGV